MAAAFPIGVDGAKSFAAKDAGGKAAVGAGEDKHRVAPRIGARPGGKLREIRSM
jgi:hypothetical protein